MSRVTSGTRLSLLSRLGSPSNASVPPPWGVSGAVVRLLEETMTFPLTHFMQFANALLIDTKEKGMVRLGQSMMGTQRYLLRNIVQGFEDGKREFVTLKCRQAGISTLSLALDLFWLQRHKGMTGMLAVHEDTARDQFRSTLELYYAGLPDEWKRPIKDHNRNQLVLSTGTKLLYRVAGTKKSGGGSLGRSSAPSFLHATEMSSWGDPEGFASLRASLAQKNPNRFYHWESTARGFNMFYDQWKEAQVAVSQQTIFVSWWANEFYRFARGTEVYNSYYGKNGRLTTQEREWAKEVKALYGIEIDDEQIAWWRWLSAEQQQDESIRLQEFPWTETQAFQASGSQFFNASAMSNLYQEVARLERPEMYRLRFGNHFLNTEVHQANSKNCTLKVWQNPQKHAFYVLGADPAYGSSDEADSFCCSVWRVWSDGCEQVAEFADNTLTTAQFAWVIAYLAGAYAPCTYNLEINGPGQAVLNELQNMKKEKVFGSPDSKPILRDVLKNMREFMYRKYDSMYGGAGALHTQTTFQMKERMMNNMRDYIERGMALVSSKDLLDEMKTIVRESGSAPSASSNARDDRVVAAALAILAWNDQVRTRLMSVGLTRRSDREQQENANKTGVEVRGPAVVRSYLKDIGFLVNQTDALKTNVRTARGTRVQR